LAAAAVAVILVERQFQARQEHQAEVAVRQGHQALLVALQHQDKEMLVALVIRLMAVAAVVLIVLEHLHLEMEAMAATEHRQHILVHL
jgi:hypothetical protein